MRLPCPFPHPAPCCPYHSPFSVHRSLITDHHFHFTPRTTLQFAHRLPSTQHFPFTVHHSPLTVYRSLITDYRLPLLHLHTTPSHFPTIHRPITYVTAHIFCKPCKIISHDKSLFFGYNYKNMQNNPCFF